MSKSKPTSPHRIIILENLERASHQAPQALLKLIEEPPPHSIFIFTTKNHHQLLDTILSRMTVIRIPHEKQDFEISDEIQNFLAGKNTIEKFQLITNKKIQRRKRQNSNIKIHRSTNSPRKIFHKTPQSTRPHPPNTTSNKTKSKPPFNTRTPCLNPHKSVG